MEEKAPVEAEAAEAEAEEGDEEEAAHVYARVLLTLQASQCHGEGGWGGRGTHQPCWKAQVGGEPGSSRVPLVRRGPRPVPHSDSPAQWTDGSTAP